MQNQFIIINTISLKLPITNYKIIKRDMIYNSDKTLKYLGINLTKNALLDLYEENF